MSETTQAQSSEHPWKKEFDSRIEAFANAAKINMDTVIAVFKDLGVDGEEEDCLTILDNEEYLPSSDIFKKFVDGGHAKIARVRMGLAHLRGKTQLEEAKPTLNGETAVVAEAITKLAERNRRVEDYSLRELLERYDENHPEAVERLSKLTHGRPCIVLNNDGTVNVDESEPLARTAMKQPTSDRHVIKGKVVRVWRPGTEFPVKPLDESPFFVNVALVNGVCARSGTDWNGIEHDARVLVRIYVHEIESGKLNKMQMRTICEDARKGVDHMRQTYAEAAMRYDELKEIGELPSLKVRHNDARSEPSGRKDTAW